MARPAKPLRLRLRKDTGIYEIVGPHPTTGRRVRVQTGERDENKAKAFFAIYLAEAKAAHFDAPTKRPTVQALLNKFCDATATNLASPGTRQRNIAHLIRHLGDFEPWQLKNAVLETYRDARRGDSFRVPNTAVVRKGVSDATIRRELCDLKLALDWGADADFDGWFRGRRQPRLKFPVGSSSSPRRKFLRKDQVRKVLEHAAPHCRLFIELAVRTGARAGAILALTWDQIDLENGIIDYGDDVGNKRRPIQRLPDELLHKLGEAREIACSNCVIEYGGKPTKSIDRAFEGAVVRAGFIAGHYANGDAKPAFTVHALKHSSITWLIEAGMRYADVATFTGTSEATVRKHYAHHDVSISAEAHAATAL